MKLREKRESGFTLIELLVVILIIGILSAIAIPAFLNQRKSAAEASLKSDLKSAAVAMETETIKTKSYPSTIPATIKTSDGVTLSMPAAKDYQSYGIKQEDGSLLDVDLKIVANTLMYNEYSDRNLRLVAYTLVYCQQGSQITASSPAISMILVPNADPNAVSWKKIHVCSSGYEVNSVKLEKYTGQWDIKSHFDTFTISKDSAPKNKTFCIQGFHNGEPLNVWKYTSVDGGLKEGSC